MATNYAYHRSKCGMISHVTILEIACRSSGKKTSKYGVAIVVASHHMSALVFVDCPIPERSAAKQSAMPTPLLCRLHDRGRQQRDANATSPGGNRGTKNEDTATMV